MYHMCRYVQVERQKHEKSGYFPTASYCNIVFYRIIGQWRSAKFDMFLYLCMHWYWWILPFVGISKGASSRLIISKLWIILSKCKCSNLQYWRIWVWSSVFVFFWLRYHFSIWWGWWIRFWATRCALRYIRCCRSQSCVGYWTGSARAPVWCVRCCLCPRH